MVFQHEHRHQSGGTHTWGRVGFLAATLFSGSSADAIQPPRCHIFTLPKILQPKRAAGAMPTPLNQWVGGA